MEDSIGTTNKYNLNIFAVIRTTFLLYPFQRCTPDVLVTAISSKGKNDVT